MNEEVLKELKEINKNLEQSSQETHFVNGVLMALAMVGSFVGLAQIYAFYMSAQHSYEKFLYGGIGMVIAGTFVVLNWFFWKDEQRRKEKDSTGK